MTESKTAAPENVLRFADENPWYVLATIHGEADAQPDEDSDLTQKNRRIWNAWACQEMDKEDRDKLAVALELDPDELGPWSNEEQLLVENEFEKRLGKGSRIPSPAQDVDFEGVEFEKDANFEKFVFSSLAKFFNATFRGDAHFEFVTFCGSAHFEDVTFRREVDFSLATFRGSACFNRATSSGDTGFCQAEFCGSANFEDATFTEGAVFSFATFCGQVCFNRTTFPADAYFDDVTFRGEVYFKDATFHGPTVFTCATFKKSARFSRAKFGFCARFNRATFSGNAHFYIATFTGRACFNRATFSSNSCFSRATFRRCADFDASKFGRSAVFNDATFRGGAYFKDVTFSGEAHFEGVTFSSCADFKNATFKSTTKFEHANFKNRVPEFYEATLYEVTTFTIKPGYWPVRNKGRLLETEPLLPSLHEQTSEDAPRRAYNCLRRIMNDLHKPSEEHFFYCQEMRAKSLLQGFAFRFGSKTFDWLSEYGYSLNLTVSWLSGFWFFPAVIFWVQSLSDDEIDWWTGFGYSFSNLFAFLGFHGRYFSDRDPFAGLSDWNAVLSGTQTFMGIVLLFLLGLTLRNGFRH